MDFMHYGALALALLLPVQPDRLGPGRHARTIRTEDAERSYVVYVPEKYDSTKPTPVVIALHGASMNARQMELFTGLSKKAEEAGFIVVYPNGTGIPGLLTWNAGAFPPTLSKRRVDDVGFMTKVLDEVTKRVNVDTKRVYCTGLSNGGMMAYRLASEMSHRIAAVASVSGTMVCEDCNPKRAVPILHFHGTKDALVPYAGLDAKVVKLRSVEETIQCWVKADGCSITPDVADVPGFKEDLKVTRKRYNSGRQDSEVVLYTIDGGGHAWPGRPSPGGLLGATTYTINANDLIWEFFERHPLP